MCSLRFRGNLRRELYRTIFGIKATDHLITLFRPIIRDERSGTSLHASRETVELISSGIAFREYLNVKYGVVELEDTNLRVRIKNVAIEHFNKNGYHGTTIRNIAREVNCSLPMIYYYYKSKKDLFDEIVTNDYLLLLKMLAENVNKADPIEFYTELVNNLNSLSDLDRHLYRLGIKVYMSFDGDEEHIQAMERYEESVFTRHAEILRPYLLNPADCAVVVRTLIHLVDTLIVEIVVKGRFISEEDIRAEISLILSKNIQPSTHSF